jgi:localization factor PodJL
MTAGAPRSARYVDPTSREVAEDLARRSGLSLGEWVSRLMAEGPEDATSQDYFSQPMHSNYVETPRPSPPRYETVVHPVDEVGRVTGAIDRLSERIEGAESRQALAIAGIERSVREVITRIDAAEREQMQVAARFEGAVQETKGETARLGERLRRIEEEAAGPRSVEALRALEGALGKVAGHVYEGEQRSRDGLGELRGRVQRLDVAEQATGGAIRELKAACSALDSRLNLAEQGAEESLARAAANLSARVEATREDLTAQLAAAADARFDRMEQTLAKMGEHVRAAEQRQTGALERMGREVLEVAQALNRKVHAVEHGSVQAAERVGAEVSRITGAVEDRLVRADSIQAQALEKLGGEIARITERLADRIGNAERRSAQAIDDVGEQVARITERVSQRQERTTTELADRIRQSEERTARLLEEARLKIDDRLSETQRRIAEAPRAPATGSNELDDTLFGDAPFPGFETPPAERPFAGPDASELATPRAAPSAFDDTDFDAAARFEPPQRPAPTPAPAATARREPEVDEVELEPNVGFDVDDELIGPGASVYDPMPAAPPSRPLPVAAPEPPRADPAGPAGALTTREVIERARAAAKAASDREAPARPRPAATRAADDTVVQSLTFGRSRKKPGGGMTGALMVASLMAAIGLSASGYVFLEMRPGGKLPKRVSDSLSVASDSSQPPMSANAPLAAVALSPQPAGAGPDLTGAYSAAIARINADQKDGLADLKKLADGGYAPAQFYLAELYQDGKAGLHQDPAESRRWLEKAAEGGDRTAMHNLALDYHEGVGGPKNAASAAEWFRRAAELGLLDSQFNLAALYEHGDGVSQNAAEAYKWYLIAGRSGDAEARAGALRVRTGLSADERAMAERAAQDFQPQAPNASTLAGPAPAAAVAAPQPDIVTAQRALNQLGYYQGPTDGAASPALHLALAAYQRDQSLPVTGDPDAATVGKLQVYTR